MCHAAAGAVQQAVTPVSRWHCFLSKAGPQKGFALKKTLFFVTLTDGVVFNKHHALFFCPDKTQATLTT